jgi:hypothetical protein
LNAGTENHARPAGVPALASNAVSLSALKYHEHLDPAGVKWAAGEIARNNIDEPAYAFRAPDTVISPTVTKSRKSTYAVILTFWLTCYYASA